MSLYPFQKAAVEFHLTHHYSLNCSEMGAGKTRMALETAKLTGLKVAVFGPAFLRGTWFDEAKVVGIPIDYFSYSNAHKLSPKDLSHCGVFIADECHYLKNPTTIRTHAFHSLLEGVKPEYFVGLTGTPIKNRVFDFWTLIAFCTMNPKKTSGPDLEGPLRKYKAFARHFCRVDYLNLPGKRMIERFGGIKEDRIPEFKALLEGKYLRFKVADVLKDLPEMTRKHVRLEIEGVDPALEGAYQDYLGGSKTNIVAKVNSALLKASLTAEYCKEMQEEGSGPLVIFTDHVQAAEEMAKKLKTIAITGQTPMIIRQDRVKAFQDGKTKVIVATIGALSVGVTLTAARHVVFNDLSWIPADNLQAEKRIHRIGQKDACFSHFIEATATDSHINKMLLEKLDSINKVVD